MMQLTWKGWSPLLSHLRLPASLAVGRRSIPLFLSGPLISAVKQTQGLCSPRCPPPHMQSSCLNVCVWLCVCVCVCVWVHCVSLTLPVLCCCHFAVQKQTDIVEVCFGKKPRQNWQLRVERHWNLFLPLWFHRVRLIKAPILSWLLFNSRGNPFAE